MLTPGRLCARCTSIAATDRRACSSLVPGGNSNTSEASNGLLNRTGEPSVLADRVAAEGTLNVTREPRSATTAHTIPRAAPRTMADTEAVSIGGHLRDRTLSSRG